MKKLTIIIAIIAAFSLSSNAFAQNTKEECTTPKQANIKVNGLICDFCARALEKVFSKREEVSGIKVDLTKGTIDVNFNEGKNIDDAALTKLITDSGYNVTAINKQCN